MADLTKDTRKLKLTARQAEYEETDNRLVDAWANNRRLQLELEAAVTRIAELEREHRPGACALRLANAHVRVAELQAVIEAVGKYADNRAAYGRAGRTVGSARIASDLFAILGPHREVDGS